MNEKMNAIGLLVAVLLLGAVGVTILTFGMEAEAIPCKSHGSYIHNKRCSGYIPK